MCFRPNYWRDSIAKWLSQALENKTNARKKKAGAFNKAPA
jgi:hypothetical protein